LDDWLNGSVFPLTTRMMIRIGADHLQRAAGVFAGDSPEGQQHLAFDAYDFSYIPIETLSVVYEQFLHARKTPSGPTVGRQRGAYYTPLPVVNFIIDRMDEVKPLHAGMRVLDPACGSGAFLVQCYRKLIEDRLRSTASSKLRPPELRELLVRHVFGIDVDAEACRVAELSLLLTMLDYIDPPDLTNTTFKLPDLSGTNIIEANAFDDGHEFLASAKARGFDWIIGNPPWNEIAAETTDPVDKRVLEWINAHRNDNPTGGNQAAEAFLWRARDLAQPDGVAGLLVPAMILFKSESRAFRERFFGETRLTYAANFSNLAEVLFAGRSRVPAAALIFRPSLGEAGKVPVFSPLVANQEPTRPRTESTRVDTWSLIVDENELRFVDQRDVAGGDSLVWKLAAWGSELDRSILRRTASLGSLGELVDAADLRIAEGMQLRAKPTGGSDPAEHHPELSGELTIDLKAMAGCRLLFAFPHHALTKIPPELTWVRVRGGYASPERVSRPPHILVNAARNWAVFSTDYVVVPPRQIGIAGSAHQADLLKALTLYLNSHFVQYHQFFAATQAGVKREVGTLRALRTLPIPTPLGEREQSAIESWARLHDELRACDASAAALDERKREDLLVKANKAVNAALRLREQDRVRIADFVDVILGLRDGKVEERAVREPEPQELRAYAGRLRRELDAFIGKETGVSHGISIWRDNREGIIEIELAGRDGDVTVHPPAQSFAVMKQVASIRSALAREFSQWRYFNRNLRIFSDERVYLFKPLQRFHWLESQAIQDAGEVVALVLHRVPAPA
jgi:methylase of polypeptide subunit release factors